LDIRKEPTNRNANLFTAESYDGRTGEDSDSDLAEGIEIREPEII
jgi:hypothetical protein